MNILSSFPVPCIDILMAKCRLLATQDFKNLTSKFIRALAVMDKFPYFLPWYSRYFCQLIIINGFQVVLFKNKQLLRTKLLKFDDSAKFCASSSILNFKLWIVHRISTDSPHNKLERPITYSTTTSNSILTIILWTLMPLLKSDMLIGKSGEQMTKDFLLKINKSS